MPAQLDDPQTKPHYRRSAAPPYPDTHSTLPASVQPITIDLKQPAGTATLLPFSSPSQLPQPLLELVRSTLNIAIEAGDTYPMIDALTPDIFGPYWFGVFGTVLVKGTRQYAENLIRMALRNDDLVKGLDWGEVFLGSFYVKPNYPGRSSHVCNAGFLVPDRWRGVGVGGAMGKAYLEWAPKLGYTYSMFNLVYENNDASVRIWDKLGFDRIGRVPGCGNLKGTRSKYIDAIIFGKQLGESSERVKEDAALEEATVKGTS